MMKKLIFLSLFSALFFGVSAQIPTPWNTTGNSGVSTTNFLGTTNCAPLVFKTAGIERMRLLKADSRLGIGFSQPQASLHLHYQEDDVLCDGGERSY